MLKEAARVLRPGRPAVRVHPRPEECADRARPSVDQRARASTRAGRPDRHAAGAVAQVRSRQSADGHSAISSRVAADTGFRVARIRYYTPLVGGFVENILMRMAERQLARRAARKLDGQLDAEAIGKEAVRSARTSAKAQIARSPSTRGARRPHKAMRLDLLLFGRIQSGPFFALLEKTGANPIPPESGARFLYSAIDQVVPGPKGGSVHVAAIAEGLAALGHDVTALVTPGASGVPSTNSRVRWIGMMPPLGSTHLRMMRRGSRGWSLGCDPTLSWSGTTTSAARR